MNRSIRQLLVLAAILAVLPAASATASPLEVLQDCNDDGELQGEYTRGELLGAQQQNTGVDAEYTGCRSAIAAALGSLAGKSSRGPGDGGPGGNDGTAAKGKDGKLTPSERRATKERRKRERREIAGIGTGLTPDGVDSLGADEGGGDGTSLPLVLALIMLLCVAVAAGAWYAARRNPAFANALRRVPLPGRRG